MRVLAVIPGRSGSKGISGKNSKVFDGKPLISYAIESAIESKLITDKHEEEAYLKATFQNLKLLEKPN